MSLHKPRLLEKSGGTDPTTPPPTPVSESEMTLDSGRTLHLSPEAKNLLDYLRNGPDYEENSISLLVYYYLPGETDSSDSSPPFQVPPRSFEQRGAGLLRSSDPTGGTGSQQDRGTASSQDSHRLGFSLPLRDDRVANGTTKDKALCKTCPIHCPHSNENNGDGTLRTTGLREYFRSLLGTCPTITGLDSPSGAQRSMRPIISGRSRPSSRQRSLKHRRRQGMDEWEFSFLDPEYDSESDTTPLAISPPSLHLPVRSPPPATARSSHVTTPRQRSRTASRMSSLTPSRSPLAPPQRFSPLVDPRVENKSSHSGSPQGSPPRSPPTSPPPQHTSPPLQANTVPQLVTLRRPTGSSLASPSSTLAIHPPVSSVPRTMTAQPESQPLNQGAPAPAVSIRPLLAPLQIPTPSRSSPDLFSPIRERGRPPLRREESVTSLRSSSIADAFASALATTTTTSLSSGGTTMVTTSMMELAPLASPAIVPSEENQSVSGKAVVVVDLGSSSAVGDGRVATSVDNLSIRSRRRGGAQEEPGEVQVLRSARIRNMQAKREADTEAPGSTKKTRK